MVETGDEGGKAHNAAIAHPQQTDIGERNDHGRESTDERNGQITNQKEALVTGRVEP